uniref:(northern house mosquito) hypothetical protein n=1 Tax=Culex pipiens TaxID=7175 RepID=A0A8D8CFA7_CULPI
MSEADYGSVGARHRSFQPFLSTISRCVTCLTSITQTSGRTVCTGSGRTACTKGAVVLGLLPEHGIRSEEVTATPCPRDGAAELTWTTNWQNLYHSRRRTKC